MGDGLLVDAIEERLELTPSSVRKKGQSYKDNPAFGRCQTNVWLWRNPDASDVPLGEQITSLLDVLEPKKDILKEMVAAPQVEAQLFLGVCSAKGTAAMYLPNALLQRIAKLGLSVDFDLYLPADD